MTENAFANVNRTIAVIERMDDVDLARHADAAGGGLAFPPLPAVWYGIHVYAREKT
jgi:hypothetical protein